MYVKIQKGVTLLFHFFCWSLLKLLRPSRCNTCSSYSGIFKGDLAQVSFLLLLDYSSIHHKSMSSNFSVKTSSVVSYLRSSIGHIQVMQGDILNNFLFLVHVPLWQGNILFSFKVKFRGIDITPALPLRKAKKRNPGIELISVPKP